MKKSSQKSFEDSNFSCYNVGPNTDSGLPQGSGGVEVGEAEEGVHLAEILSNSSLGLRLQLFGRVHRLQVCVKRG